MTTPTLESVLQSLSRCRTMQGKPIVMKGASPEDIKAASLATGLQFPLPLQLWLSKVNGLEIMGAQFYGANKIAETVNQIPVYRNLSLLPVAGDGCGNHYLAALDRNPADPPIVFVEGIAGRDVVSHIAASTLYAFIQFAVEYSLSPDDSLWPGDKDYVLEKDPGISSFGYSMPWEAS